MSYAKGTDVPVERSRAEIEKTLAKYGADAFGYAQDGPRQMIMFRLAPRTGNPVQVRIELPLPGEDAWSYTERGVPITGEDGRMRRRAQLNREAWRALLLVVKAKLTAVEAGITTLEREFLADVMTPSGRTVGEELRPQLTEMYSSGRVPHLLPGGGQ